MFHVWRYHVHDSLLARIRLVPFNGHLFQAYDIDVRQDFEKLDFAKGGDGKLFELHQSK
jgi:hypothetical protein